MSKREHSQLMVVRDIDGGRMTARKGAELLGLSVRQVRRKLAAYREEGAAGLVHGNRGRVSPLRTPKAIQQKMIVLMRYEYRDYNDCHLTEELAEKHGIHRSRSTVRRIRRSIGQDSPRKRKAPRHRSRRERCPRAGMLLQLDGSNHDWLEGRGPRLTLITAIDDATGEVAWALFRVEEDAAGYFELLQGIAEQRGLPLAVYTDRHTIFMSPKKPSLEERLAGAQPRSQFGRLLDELSIEHIRAWTPQAKGRVERLFGTLQDRLVKELRAKNACTLEQANQVVQEYLPRFNARFAVVPAEAEPAYRPWPVELRPGAVFCFKHRRTVNNDNTVSFSGQRLQIPRGADRISYARAKVEVQQRLDGSLVICYQDRVVAAYLPKDAAAVRVEQFVPAPGQFEPSPAIAQPIQQLAERKERQPYKPPLDHPWRRPAVLSKSK